MIISAINNFYHNKYPKSIEKGVQKSPNILYFGSRYDSLFPAAFFNKLLHEGIPCAYTGVKLIPKNDVRILKEMGTMQRPIDISIDYLKGFEQNLYSTEQKILKIIAKEKENYPDSNIEGIFKKLYPSSEKRLRTKQLNILNKIILESRKLPERSFNKVRNNISYIANSLTKKNAKGVVLDPGSIHRILLKVDIRDEKLANRLTKLIKQIPTEKNSTDAYIVAKTKLKPPHNTTLSQHIALDLLKSTVASNEHFWPQESYRLEERGKTPFRVSVLTSHFVNQLKGNMLPDDFIKTYRRYKVKNNMQAQVDRLVQIHGQWHEVDKPSAKKLLKYILTLKYEIEKRSKLVKINIDEFINNLSQSKKDKLLVENSEKEVKELLKIS